MVLTVLSDDKSNDFSKKSDILLNKYLSGAVSSMNDVDRSEWKAKAKEYTRQPHGGIMQSALDNKDKELAVQANAFDIKTKTAFALNATQNDRKVGMAGAFALSVAAISASFGGADIAAVSSLVASAVAYPVVRRFVNSKVAPNNEAESQKLTEFEQIKKTQLALKMLKRAFKQEDKIAKTADERLDLFAYRTYQER